MTPGALIAYVGEIRGGFTAVVTFEMGFDEGVEAHPKRKKTMNSVQKRGNAAVDFQRAAIPIPRAGLGSRPCSKPTPLLQAHAQYMEQGASNLLNPKI